MAVLLLPLTVLIDSCAGVHWLPLASVWPPALTRRTKLRNYCCCQCCVVVGNTQLAARAERRVVEERVGDNVDKKKQLALYKEPQMQR